ncbi:MAG: hypothetical protein AAF288_07610 [Planctomycetota bacterium]
MSMRSPGLGWGMALFTLVWFGAVLPGHERGAIRLPGRTPGQARAVDNPTDPSNPADPGLDTAALDYTATGVVTKCPSCVFLKQQSSDSNQQDAPGEPSPCRGGCALCQFIGTLDSPAPFDLIQVARLAERLPPLRAVRADPARWIPGPPPARGPPARSV